MKKTMNAAKNTIASATSTGATHAWSPSGRTLAVAKTTGELYLLEGS